ncbi:MAG TPA: ABC transporter family substrate-binding protein [Pseudonocardia sp.]|jgi:peptide/nickel transport system substrate-binding protein|uniref:ABC transporter family substrate-binding protein n=1 Tax=Pseudonocardia sp. TaxID=60912 RepID=UPI002B4B3303|nr:ABC transporter family substrate-binding protein [Pseudonocardia sp.]HLU58978.1 ABC transporter family substrate-binding protein [Pseudonocardia sp.]
MRRSRAAALAAIGAVATLVLAACGGGGGGGDGDPSEDGIYADCKANPNTCNAVPASELQQGGTITFAIEKNIPNWNINSSEGNVFEPALAIKTLLPWTFTTTPDLKMVLNENVLVSAEQTSTSPQTIVYEIRPEAVWNDGTPITADDFVFQWKTMNGKDCPGCAAAQNAGYDQIESITGSNDGKTVTVVFGTPYADWKNLFASGTPLYPAHIAAQQGDLNTPEGLQAAWDWFGATVPTYSGGPFQVESWQDNVALTLVPNPSWYGETKPKLDKLIMRVITDATQEPIALQNDEVQVVYPQPQVDLVEQLENIPGVSQYQGLGLTWEHLDLNLANEFLADEALRDAIFVATDVQAIIDSTVGQFNEEVTPLKSHMFVPGQEGFEEYLPPEQGSGDIERARQILTEAGYTNIGEGQQLTTPDGRAVPPLRIRYTVGNAIRQTTVELIQAQVRPLGLNLEIVPTDDLGETTDSGDYDLIVFAWVQTPASFSNAQQTWLSTSESNYGQYNNPEVDRMLNEAATSTDLEAARNLLNEAGAILAEDSYVLPLYQKPTIIAARDDVANARNNSSLDGPTYNVEEWGLRASS